MADDRSRPSCVRCGERVGVYERLWFERHDGVVVPSSVLTLWRQGVDPLGLSLWHHACLPEERLPTAP